jgi:hypothetical protein
MIPQQPEPACSSDPARGNGAPVRAVPGIHTVGGDDTTRSRVPWRGPWGVGLLPMGAQEATHGGWMHLE